MKRYLFPLIIGLGGVAILVSLGVWQVQRLAWKEGVLADISARIAAQPVALPAQPNPQQHAYLPVRAEGTVTDGLRVLASAKRRGAGYRMISVFETDGRKVLLDRGFLSVDAQADAGAPQEITVTGNLHWPDEVDGFTPEPDTEMNLWFARDVPAMAAALGTEPVLIIARRIEPAGYAAEPMPVGATGIPNDHLEYAITWFSLAIVWAGMTAFLLWRIRQRTA
ncbi:Cytochrome oxidase biogenesis protein Surf1 [Candidatus Rhodobacter oscarellae]|uniref:SURF1-like protein n=1 Tax=Candidatus Rhodobacter oscarellae TaxID=1675527 RepID=A0A0J9ECT6_9RHOB|nr:SURF1 family protein [Candidatus Rhodobacter lobularis]KMW59544.1 Cytochrome oxidase biogenesis protein Surf1 [Candidatus Rhodobacter lobularis]